jgi:hypothetical protein
MVSVKVGGPAQAVLQGAERVLFVEGKPHGLDVAVLGELLSPRVRVAPLGPSFSVRSVATALHAEHPNYWFVIDRDEWDDDAVEASWQSFPDPKQHNLLIWRRKELESYFLEPDWVVRSRYLKVGANEEQITSWLEKQASETVWLDASNLVIVWARNAVKRAPCELLDFQDVKGLDRQGVEARLLATPGLGNLASVSAAKADPEVLRAAYAEACTTLSGDVWPLSFNAGRWRDLIPAKALFRSLVNRWFKVPDLAKGGTAQLTGRDAESAVATDLLKNHQDSAPADLRALKQVLEGVI